MAPSVADEGANAETMMPADPPRQLNADAQLKWRETWPLLDHSRFDVCRDGDNLAQYCEAWADIRQADREIERLKEDDKPDPGKEATTQASNQTTRLREDRVVAMERFDKAAEKLGLSLYAPTSRPWPGFLGLLKSFPQELAERDDKEIGSRALGQRRIWTLKRVWIALQRSCGSIAAAALLLSQTYGVTCAPAKISSLVRQFPQLREAIEESKEAMYETCRGVVMKAALAGDMHSRHLALRLWHPDFQD